MRWGEGGRGGGEWLEPNHRGWLENTALCSLQREAPLRGAPAPWMTDRGYLRFQWKLITSKRSSQVELFISLSLIGCKNLRAILHNLSAKFNFLEFFRTLVFRSQNHSFLSRISKNVTYSRSMLKKIKTYHRNVYFLTKTMY